MEMRANHNVGKFEDVTPAIASLAFSLYSSCLSSHCSSCGVPLSDADAGAGTSTSSTSSFLNYCSSPSCATIDSHIHHASGEHHLFIFLNSHPSAWPLPDTCYLRLALRFLLLLPPVVCPSSSYHLSRVLPAAARPFPRRLLGLFPGDPNKFPALQLGAILIGRARSMRDGLPFDGCQPFLLEQRVLSLVMINAVDVNPVGVAVFDWRFSWINHSCSPNSCFRFVPGFGSQRLPREDFDAMAIHPFGDQQLMLETRDFTASGFTNGPRVVVRTIKPLQSGEEVTISYTDLLKPRALRRPELLRKYQFSCSCRRCGAMPQAYVDHALEDILCTDLHSYSANTYDLNFAIEMLAETLYCNIQQYMEKDDLDKCWKDIEVLLSKQHINGSMEFKLSPLHHLSIYAYKFLSQLRTGKDQVINFDFRRTSVAYGLLLAGATHKLFMSEPSLVTYAAKFWVDVGEYLLELSKSEPIVHTPAHSVMHMVIFESSSFQTRDFDDISREFFTCLSISTPKVWSFLAQGSKYLEEIKDPINFLDLSAHLSLGHWSDDDEELGHGHYVDEEVASDVSLLGIRCKDYGDYLYTTCCGGFHLGISHLHVL